MSIDDIAHATRIHATNVLGLEEDDYSGFASTTYAKSFLSLYAGFLEVDATEALEQFAGSSAVSFGGPISGVAERIDTSERDGYFSRSGSATGGAKRRPAPSSKGDQGGAPIFLGLILLLLLIAIPTFWFIGRDAASPEEAIDNAKKLSKGQIESVSPKATAPDSTAEPTAETAPERAPGPNPDAASPVGEPPATPVEPVRAQPVGPPVVARPVDLSVPFDPAPEPATPEPAPEPKKPKNQFGFPGD